MRILIGCEFSGVVRSAFRTLGHDAYSCDLLPAADGSPHHLQCDVLAVLDQGWDLMVSHPPCTYLTISAEWAYSDGPYHQKVKPGTLVGAARRAARIEAVVFVRALLAAPIPRIALENPVGCLSRLVRPPDQYVQPYEFGHDASKKTGLWLKNLPPLPIDPAQYVPPRLVNGKPRWANQTDSGQNKLSPGDDRWAKRSVTYEGIARAFAETWGKLS